MKIRSILIVLLLFSFGTMSSQTIKKSGEIPDGYLDYSGTDVQNTGGIKMIPIETPKGTFNVYTKQVGNNPKMKVLLLHGGPGGTHEFFTVFDGYLPKEGIEYIYYDQLGSYYSDQPMDPDLWTIEHFVEEVEQVRKALDLDKDNFYLLGQSWGGILALEYALKYQENLKGLIVSNIVSDVASYNKYAQEVLGPMLPPEVLKELRELEAKKDYTNPRYEELLLEHYYTEHLLREPLHKWPKSVMLGFQHLNKELYTYMQGPSEFGITEEATLSDWDIRDQLKDISVPTLMIGAEYDTVDPDHMKWMASEVQNGRFHLCPDSGHVSQYDEPEVYFDGLIRFIKDVDKGRFGNPK